MAVDIKKMVDTICSLTVLELCKLVKALKDKFRLETEDAPEPVPEPEPEETSEQVTPAESTPSEGTPEREDQGGRSEEKRRVPDPTSVPDPGPSSVPLRDPSPVKLREGENFYFVYAWKYSGDNRYAKIGETSKESFRSRFVKTYHPTDDPILIGIFECNSKRHAQNVESELLKQLKRTRLDLSRHEWVEADEVFNEMIDLYFISDPDVLVEKLGEFIKREELQIL